jgi:hypothetical protein
MIVMWIALTIAVINMIIKFDIFVDSLKDIWYNKGIDEVTDEKIKRNKKIKKIKKSTWQTANHML